MVEAVYEAEPLVEVSLRVTETVPTGLVSTPRSGKICAPLASAVTVAGKGASVALPWRVRIEAAEAILATHPDERVVLFSAFLDDELEARARRAGVAVCVDKVQAVDLPAILRHLLAHQ